MEMPNPKDVKAKKWHVFVVTILVTAAIGFGIWLFWLFGLAELAAKCDDGFTIWRRNPGAWSSYIYEIRDGVTLIETDLRSKDLNDFSHEHHCVFLGGG